MSVDDYVTRFLKMIEELQEAGISVTDNELSLISLNNLDELYDPLSLPKAPTHKTLALLHFLG